MTAPAGCGKTDAVARWCARQSLPVTWVDLEDVGQDADQLRGRVIDGVAEAVGIDADVAREVLATGAAPPTPKTMPAGIIVFDHVPIWPAKQTVELIDVLTTWHDCGLHGVAIGRCPPPPELVPLRMRGVVGQLTTADLMIDAGTTAAVVEAYSGRSIDATVAEELSELVQGWMAGVVMVGLLRPDGEAATADALVDAAWEAIEGYLTTEVIDRVPDDLRWFMLRTSCVDELAVELCDQLIDRSDGEQWLRSLVASGVPVGRDTTDRRTYRYQTQLRTVLDDRFRREDAEGRAAALRTAADWYNAHQMPFDAAECFVRLNEWDDVISTIMLHMQSIIENDELARISGFVMRAPPALLREQSGLAVGGAAMLLADGRLSAANEILSLYQPYLTPPQRMIADLIRASMYAWQEDMSVPLGAADAAEDAADELGDDYVYQDLYNPSTTDFYRVQVQTSGLVACAYAGWWERARRHLVDVRPETASALPHVNTVVCRGRRAQYFVLAGEVTAGLEEAKLALTIASEADMSTNSNASEAHYAMGEGMRLAGRLDQVTESVELAAELAAVNGRRNLIAAATASQAHLLVDQGRSDQALQLLEAYRDENRHRAPETLSALLAAAEARAFAASGDFFAALRVLGDAPSTSATAEVEVAVTVTLGKAARAGEVLRRWPDEPTSLSRVRRSLASAVVHDATGSVHDCMRSLRAGLVVAATHELVQPVAVWGGLIARLLRRLDRRGLDGQTADIVRRAETLIAGGGSIVPRFTSQELVVLAHLDRGLSGPAAAEQMSLSVNTVKTHIKSIYRKFGVTSRAEALAAWRELRHSGDGR